MIIDTVKGVVALIVVGALAVGAFLGWQRWREIQLERHAVAEAEVKREAAVVAQAQDSLLDGRRQLDVALIAGRSILAAPSLRRPRVSRPIPPASVLDTIAVDMLRRMIEEQRIELDSLRVWGDSIEMRLAAARDTLTMVIAAGERYRLYAELTIGAQGRQIAAMQTVIDTPKPRRRWGLGGAGGYCSLYQRADPRVAAVRESIRSGPGVCVGLSFSF